MRFLGLTRSTRFFCFLTALTAWLAGDLRSQPFDLVIRHGRIVDGTGAAAVAGDIAIRDRRIVAIGTFSGQGRVEIDAHDRIVAPGFIDVHTHSEDITELPVAENFIRMGVTTIVTGNCGGSKLEIGAFLKSVEQTGTALNVATLIGHNTVRSQVMGGSFARPPTAAELDQMKALVDRGMRDGAVGLSTGLIYLPGTFATTEEIIALAQRASAYGGIYASHMRYENDRIMEALNEVLRIAREARIPAEVSHIKLSGPAAWEMAGDVLKLLDAARAEGIKVTQDQYLYTASSTSLGTPIPAEAREGGRQRFRERLADPVEKARMVAEMKETLKRSRRTDYAYAVIANFEADTSLNGKSVPEVATLRRGSATLDDQIETILEIEAQGGASAVFHGMSEENLKRFLVHPMTMVASDSGPRRFGEAVPHPRGYGNNARVLAHYVREKHLLSLEEAVRKMTSLPARTFSLEQRGELRPGFFADLVIFDLAAVQAPSWFGDPHHYAVGFDDVIVQGVPIIRGGQLTGARPGAALRHKSATTPVAP
ncbi:MAG: D-aminoacylase [Opitutaceae bacterium]